MEAVCCRSADPGLNRDDRQQWRRSGRSDKRVRPSFVGSVANYSVARVVALAPVVSRGDPDVQRAVSEEPMLERLTATS